MKIIYLNDTREVLYAGDSIELHGTFAVGPSGAHDPSTTTGTATLAIVESLPADYSGGRYRYTLAGAFERTEAGGAAAAAALDAAKAEQLKLIDADVDAIFDAVVGKRATEYQDALADAQQYRDAGWTGPVPAGVASWAAAKASSGWTARQAAEDILATGETWLAAQQAIRAARLLRKEQTRTSTSPADLAAVLAQWAGFVQLVRSQLGVVA